MSRVRQNFSFAAILAINLGFQLPTPAHAQTNGTFPSQTDPNTGELLPPSPVEFFRELMARDAEKRKEMLANRAPEDRKQIEAKIREYKALKPEQRDLKLKATELRWYFKRLMTVTETNRAPQLARLSEKDRKLVEERLRAWDKLPAAAQKQLQTNEAWLIVIAMPEQQKSNFLAHITPDRSNYISQGIARLQAMPELERQKLLDRFGMFFDFAPQETRKILSPLSEAERQQIEKTLNRFAGLSPLERDQCIRSFQKFALMSDEERQQFLKNAERWKLLTPTERNQWKDLVESLSSLPPMPPDWFLPGVIRDSLTRPGATRDSPGGLPPPPGLAAKATN